MTVEGGEGGGEKLATYLSYPPPLATYDDIVTSSDLFFDTLKKLHLSMGTKFMVPIVGGRDLDLHRLFIEVTSRGGIAKVLRERKWKEVTAVFSFPSSATNASFILRKYYVSLLYHYEQIYFFKAKCWTPSPTDAIQNLSTISASSHGLPEFVPQPTMHGANAETSTPQVSLAPSTGSQICGVIDGKFDSGYLITVKIGMEEFKGVLYQVATSEAQNFTYQSDHKMMNHTSSLKPGGMPRRKRRKKSEIRKRDPAHPKPNRSGYNFFFAEQHALLKPHYHGRDREISRIIGESWNKLQEPERSVYQEKALKDKERYKMEMEVYRERLKNGEIIGNSTVPIQLVKATNSACYNEEQEMSSEKSDNNIEDSDYECSQADTELKNVNVEVMSDGAFDLQTRTDVIVEKNEDKTTSFGNDDIVLVEDGISVPIEGIQQAHSNANES